MIARRDHVAPPIAKRLRLYFERAAGGGPSESAAARRHGGEQTAPKTSGAKRRGAWKRFCRAAFDPLR
ncbi:hypothetical protein [Burkholderia pseudomallei]|uniref:hypothetical protein n=1 Tax=Burkholderia pseudomallei TaxID=28450 RepID=UPI000A8851D6|nr:hypothetical protein [Burkholderia pseudomallei]MDA0557918.1 hypothetical protein [Burkholderia pseudomallei]